jgi:pimeloyl-ACP methyl ester carboxylesterase
MDSDGFEHRRVEVGGLGLHLVETGPAGGRPLLLLHGFPESWWGWHRQMPLFAEAGYRVAVPDQRGYNLSDKPRPVSAYGLDRLARDVVELADLLGAERFRLAGHDWGGAVAWWVAVRWPERVEKLAILNVPHPVVMRRHLLRDPRQRRRSWYIFLFQLPWLPEWLLRRRDFAFLRRALGAIARPGTFGEEDFARYREAWRRPGALRGMVSWYRAALRRPPARLPSVRVTVPTRIFWGLDDPALGAEMIDPSVALCDRGDAVRFPGLSHWLLHEEPERVGRAMLDFFDGR